MVTMSVSAHTPGTTAETLPFDPWVLLVTLRRRLWWVVGGGLFGFALAATVAALLLRATWEARTVLVRHEQNMARNTDMPYLHQELSVNTVLETVKLRRNLEEVIERLKLPTTPERLFPRIRVRKGNKSNVFQILVVDGDRDRAVAIANTMAEVFTGSFTRVQNAAAEKMYAYYVGQRDDAREKLAAAMADGQRFREERGLLSIEKEAAATFEELTAVEIRHLDNEMQQTELETRIRVNEDFIASLPETEVLARTVNVARPASLRPSCGRCGRSTPTTTRRYWRWNKRSKRCARGRLRRGARRAPTRLPMAAMRCGTRFAPKRRSFAPSLRRRAASMSTLSVR